MDAGFIETPGVLPPSDLPASMSPMEDALQQRLPLRATARSFSAREFAERFGLQLVKRTTLLSLLV